MHTPFPAPHRSRDQRGVGLVETLVALLVVSLGLLGLLAIKSQVLKNSHSALDRTLVTTLSYQILDAMRANPEPARLGLYNLEKTCEVPTAVGDLIKDDLQYWMQSLKNNLGARSDVCGAIQCLNDRCVITVWWDDSRALGGVSEQKLLTEGTL